MVLDLIVLFILNCLGRGGSYLTGNPWIFVIFNYLSWLIMFWQLGQWTKRKGTVYSVKVFLIIITLVLNIFLFPPEYYFIIDITCWVFAFGLIPETGNIKTDIIVRSINIIIFIQALYCIFKNSWEIDWLQYIAAAIIFLIGWKKYRNLSIK